MFDTQMPFCISYMLLARSFSTRFIYRTINLNDSENTFWVFAVPSDLEDRLIRVADGLVTVSWQNINPCVSLDLCMGVHYFIYFFQSLPCWTRLIFINSFLSFVYRLMIQALFSLQTECKAQPRLKSLRPELASSQ